jgi:hypothetical protein
MSASPRKVFEEKPVGRCRRLAVNPGSPLGTSDGSLFDRSTTNASRRFITAAMGCSMAASDAAAESNHRWRRSSPTSRLARRFGHPCLATTTMVTRLHTLVIPKRHAQPFSICSSQIAPFLVLRSSRGFHHDLAALRHYQPSCRDVQLQTSVRLFRHGVCPAGIMCIGLIVWAHDVYTVGLTAATQAYFANAGDRCSGRHQSLFLDCYYVGRFHPIPHAVALGRLDSTSRSFLTTSSALLECRGVLRTIPTRSPTGTTCPPSARTSQPLA